MDNKFIENINWVYPDLVIEDCYANDIGQNNNVLIVNKSLVFRFPKYVLGITQLKKETKILEYIKNSVTIPIPHLIYQSFEKLNLGVVWYNSPLKLYKLNVDDI